MVVVPLKRTPGTVKNLKSPDEMDMEEVLTSKCVDACLDFFAVTLCVKTEKTPPPPPQQNVFNRTIELLNSIVQFNSSTFTQNAEKACVT